MVRALQRRSLYRCFFGLKRHFLAVAGAAASYAYGNPYRYGYQSYSFGSPSSYGYAPYGTGYYGYAPSSYNYGYSGYSSGYAPGYYRYGVAALPVVWHDAATTVADSPALRAGRTRSPSRNRST